MSIPFADPFGPFTAWGFLDETSSAGNICIGMKTGLLHTVKATW
jgi:hypothetical protein